MIKILSSAFGLSIQDLGRFGYRNIGVPVSGAMDMYSAVLANSILNNHKNAALLEITFGGCKMQFESDCIICITGADFSATIGDKKIVLNTALSIKKNEILSFGKRKYGVRTYLAIVKGFQTELVLGSRSWYANITPNALVKRGMRLPINSDQTQLQKTLSSINIDPSHFSSNEVNCYKGPEYDSLSEIQKRQLSNTSFTISLSNNRMGYQLEELVENNLPSMLTSTVLPGTVQLTPSGKIIVLMRDAQVTGGYPRILQLTDSAINCLAQKTTKDQIQFVIK